MTSTSRTIRALLAILFSNERHLPPSIGKTVPVTKPLVIKKSTAWATSSGRPMRPTGSLAALAAKDSRTSGPNVSQSGVSIRPGATALTRIGAKSNARARVIPSTPATAAAAIAPPAAGRVEYRPDISVIEPPSIRGTACRTLRATPIRRTSKIERSPSSSSSAHHPLLAGVPRLAGIHD